MRTKISGVIIVLIVLFTFSDKVFAWQQPPEADLEAVPIYVRLGNSVILDGSGSCDPDGYIVECRWDFDDGSDPYYEYPGDKKAEHIYESTGTYTASLEVTDNDGRDDTDTCTVYVIDFDIIYVDEDATGLYNGTSWKDAYNYLQDALAAAQSGDEIWVADGTYYPDEDTAHPGPDGTDDPEANFQLVELVNIYGGFGGDEPYDYDKSGRDFTTNETILSGDINRNGEMDSGDSYCVVTADGVDSTAVLDGFSISGRYTSWSKRNVFIDNGSATIQNCTITGGGMSNWDSAVIKNCIFENNYEGALFNGWGSPRIENCIFRNNSPKGAVSSMCSDSLFINCIFSSNYNQGYESGGGISASVYDKYTLINCVFKGNAGQKGGGMYMYGYFTELTIKNCTFVDNFTSSGGGGLHVFALDMDPIPINNCIFWRNYGSGSQRSEEDDQIYPLDSQQLIITHSCIKGLDYYSGNNNTGEDPLFVNINNPDGPDDVFGTMDDGLALKYYISPTSISPCIDAGDNTAIWETTDVIGNKRKTGSGADPDVDMGAYEAMPTVGHWKLDGNANDSSGSNNHLTASGSPVYKTDGGILDDALQFDGIDDLATKSSPTGLGTRSDFSWSAWIRVPNGQALTKGGIIMAKSPPTGDYDSNSKCLYVADNGTLAFNVGGTSGSTLASGKRVDDGLWHHVAVAIKSGTAGDNDTAKLYIDGDLDTFNSDTDWNNNSGSEPSAFKVGYANSNFPSQDVKNFDGRIDDVRFYDYVLDEDFEQAAKLVEETGYWRFVATGDSRDDSTQYRDPDDSVFDGINNGRLAEIADMTIAEKAELIIFPGDEIQGYNQPGWTAKQQLENWRDTMATPLREAGIKVLPIRGNHEVYNLTYNDWVDVLGHMIPDNGPSGEEDVTFYVEHRNALFVGMDAYDGTSDKEDHHQVNHSWLKNGYNGILDRQTHQEHVFVGAHEPAFQVLHGDCLDDNELQRDYFWNKLENESRCHVYFCGHDHFYDHAWISDGDAYIDDDVQQMVVGTSGAPLKDSGPYGYGDDTGTPGYERYPQLVEYDPRYGYTVVEVWGASNATTHWKYRVGDFSTPITYTYEPSSDIFEYTDNRSPAIVSVKTTAADELEIVFSEPLDETSAEVTGNYAISSMTIQNAVLDTSNNKTVTLTMTSDFAWDTTYTLTVSGIKDLSSSQNQVSDWATFKRIGIISLRVGYSNDDAEEFVSSGQMESLTSSDLELVEEDSGTQMIGIRFRNVNIPEDADILNAYIQFGAKDTGNLNPCGLNIVGHEALNSTYFSSSNSNISNRVVPGQGGNPTENTVDWYPPAWNSSNGTSVNQQTPDIAPLIEEIVDISGWDGSDKSIVLVITGIAGKEGRRRAWSYDGKSSAAPLMYVEYEQ